MSKRPTPVPTVKEPGELREGGSAYVIPSKSKYYHPTVIEVVPPRRRDFWRVLLGRFVPTLKVSRGLTSLGFHRTLKHVWWGPTMQKQLYASSPLLERLREGEEEDEAA